MRLLHTEALRVGYHGRAILPPIDLSVTPGEIWAIVGRNGGGKSTVVKTLLDLLPRVAGRIERAPDLRVAYVPQRDDSSASAPGRVIDVVRSGLDRGWSFLKPAFLTDRGPVREALERCELTDLARQSFATLSEGQKQRVLVARALVGDPQIMLLDEPTSAMDPIHEEAIFSLLHRLAHERALAILIVSHQLGFVPRFATHMMLVDKDDAVVEIGDRAAVLTCEACRRKYGNLLPTEPEHAHDHDHAGHAHA